MLLIRVFTHDQIVEINYNKKNHFSDEMEGTHNYAMNLIVPLMGVAPLLMLFILKGEKKSKTSKSWTRSTN